MSIELAMPFNHLVLCHPLLLLPSIFPSIRVFSNELALHLRWPKYWSFSFSISPSNEYSGLISFRMDWFDCLAVQGTHKSLLQHHSSKASFLVLSLVFGPALTSVHDYGKNHSFDYEDLCWQSNVSAFLNMLSRFVITYLPRNNHLLISGPQSPSAVILEPKEIVCHYVRIVCNFLCSVCLQQKFETVDQCHSLVIAQFYFASKEKYILEAWGQADPKEVSSSSLAPLFLCFFFLLPLSLPYINWTSQEGWFFVVVVVVFNLLFSLRSVDFLLFHFCSLSPCFVF